MPWFLPRSIGHPAHISETLLLANLVHLRKSENIDKPQHIHLLAHKEMLVSRVWRACAARVCACVYVCMCGTTLM